MRVLPTCWKRFRRSEKKGVNRGAYSRAGDEATFRGGRLDCHRLQDDIRTLLRRPLVQYNFLRWSQRTRVWLTLLEAFVNIARWNRLWNVTQLYRPGYLNFVGSLDISGILANSVSVVDGSVGKLPSSSKSSILVEAVMIYTKGWHKGKVRKWTMMSNNRKGAIVVTKKIKTLWAFREELMIEKICNCGVQSAAYKPCAQFPPVQPAECERTGWNLQCRAWLKVYTLSFTARFCYEFTLEAKPTMSGKRS